jgi:hypothetical protein
MKKVIYLVILAIVLIQSSCKEEEIPNSPKLDYYIESYDIPNLGFTPQLKVTYDYNATGSLNKYTVFSINPTTTAMEEQRHFDFSYAEGRVDGIKGYLVNSETPYIEYTYQYLPNSNVSKITEKNYAAGVNSEAVFSYSSSNELVNVSYTYSNGGAFQYVFNYINQNIVTDKTTRGDQLCSNGEYTHDQHKNPFKDLGYVDYTLMNFSSNNKLSESVNYVGCAFPTLVPQSYTYEYNDRHYPTVATTHYKSGGSLLRSQKKFFYK